jgi:polyhydroxybutyrate depolymerase
MKNTLTHLWSLLLLLALLAAPATLRAQTTIIRTLQAGGLTREYRLYVPAIYTRTSGAVPLLLNLHGYGSDNLQQENYGDFRPIADTANFLVVHPNGTIDGANNRNWNTFGPRGTGVDDVAFLSTLIDTLARRYRIDPNRVYSTGMSNGCTSGRPVPVLEIHGTADNTVPYAGGTALQFVAIPTLLSSWVQRNGCNPMPVVTAVPDINTTDGCTAERSVWSGGRNGSVVEHFRIIGGGHTWPGAAFVIGVTNQDISASREAWRFLRRYRLATLLPTRGAVLPATPKLLLLPNPATDLLQLDAGQRLPAEALTVHDALGRRLPATAQLLPDGRLQVATAGWPAGLYQLAVALPTGQVLHQKLLKQ